MKKTWILLLILCGFAMAQRPYNNQRSGYAQNILWRDLHPSTQDSIRAAIIDSITALSVDGVTVLNDGALKIKVINSTDDLPGLAADSVGMPVFVKQVGSSGTGGGIMRWTTASYTADSVAVFNGSSGKFVREEWYYGSRVFNAGWAGALGDGTTDNADAFALLRRAALAQGSGYFKLGKGTYKTSETWLDSTAFGIQYTIQGEGAGRSALSAIGDIDLLKMWDSDSAFSQLVLRDISIIGIGSGTSTKKGVWIARGTLGTLNNVNISGFKYGLYVTQCNALSVQSCRFTNNWAGVWGESSPNESSFTNFYATDNDSICFYWKGGFPVAIKSAGMSRSPIGIYADVAATVVLEDLNIEDVDNYAVYALGANVRVKNSIFNLASNSGAWAVYLSAANLWSYTTSYSVHSGMAAAVYINGTTSRAYFDPPQNTKVQWSALTGKPSVYLQPDAFQYLKTQAGIASVDTTFRMRRAYLPWNNFDVSDNVVVTRKMADGEFFRNYVFDGTDVRHSVSGGEPARQNLHRRLTGNKDVLLGSGSDSLTIVECPVDSNGYTTYISVGGYVMVEDTNSVEEFEVRPVKPSANDLSTGKLRFIIHNPNKVFATRKFVWWADVVPSSW